MTAEFFSKDGKENESEYQNITPIVNAGDDWISNDFNNISKAAQDVTQSMGIEL